MLLHPAALLLMVVLVAGCDQAVPDPPLLRFQATYGGALSGAFEGVVYAQAFRYSGIGTRDMYQIQLDATPAGQPPFTGGGVTFQKNGVAPPVGTYNLGESVSASSVSGWITIDGGSGRPDRSYYATAGTLRVERVDGNRVRGTFNVTDTFPWSAMPDDPVSQGDVTFEGRFEATFGD